MATMQSTVQRVAEEEAAQNPPADDGWKPAGPVLDPDGNAPSGSQAQSSEFHEAPGSGLRPEGDASRETLPSIGHIVVYHLRAGDSRNRRSKFPAIVMDVDEAAGELKLWVIVDDGDTWMQDRVPARAAPEPGWELVAPPREGPNELSHTVVRLADRVAELEQRLGERVGPAAVTKRGPGRPKKG